MVDQRGVESELPLEIRGDRSPNQTDESLLTPGCRLRWGGNDVPRLVHFRRSLIVECERGIGQGDGRPQGSIDLRQSLVVARVRLVSFLLEPPNRLIERLRRVAHRLPVPIRPSTGLLGDAYSFLGMRPARNAMRPLSTASFMALAIATGSWASAIAVFIKTPSAPSSIAIAAS